MNKLKQIIFWMLVWVVGSGVLAGAGSLAHSQEEDKKVELDRPFAVQVSNYLKNFSDERYLTYLGFGMSSHAAQIECSNPKGELSESDLTCLIRSVVGFSNQPYPPGRLPRELNSKIAKLLTDASFHQTLPLGKVVYFGRLLCERELATVSTDKLSCWIYEH